jgi:hypothetical protein
VWLVLQGSSPAPLLALPIFILVLILGGGLSLLEQRKGGGPRMVSECLSGLILCSNLSVIVLHLGRHATSMDS